VDIEADAIGHDLSWGTSVFSRTISTSRISATSDTPVDQSQDAPDSWGIDSSGNESAGSGELLAEAGTAIPDESEAVPVPF
ncbi:MAG: single-stranded DNA-binding protein, partial [Salinibacterium sp.]|nr:single-stranded DNA-binding protein [Salinibacterium sp.]